MGVEIPPGPCCLAAQPPASPVPGPVPDRQMDGLSRQVAQLLDLNSRIAGALFCIQGKQISLSRPLFPSKTVCRTSPWEGWVTTDYPPGWEEATSGRPRKRRGSSSSTSPDRGSILPAMSCHLGYPPRWRTHYLSKEAALWPGALGPLCGLGRPEGEASEYQGGGCLGH